MPSLTVFGVVVIVAIFSSPISSVLIGKINSAMLSMNSTDILLVNNISATDCLCEALASPSAIVAINYFSDNYTCQFFPSYEPAYQVRGNTVSTLYLIEPLPIRPCCSNLTWLLDAIANAAENYTVSINSPNNLYIDDYNRLVTNQWGGQLIQMNRFNLSIINQITLNTSFVAALSYNNGLYYIGTGVGYDSDYARELLVYNSSNMNLLTTITSSSSYFGPIRQCSFLRNNTLMIVLSQVSVSYSLILFYQINSPTNYTLLNTTIQTPNYAAYTIYKVNETFFYFTLYVANESIYTLSSSSNGQSWTVGTFVTQGTRPDLVTSVTVDSCGRLWATDSNNVIYIYNTTTGALLGTFDKIPQPYYILLLDKYELFVSTASNRVYRLAPNIQCTC